MGQDVNELDNSIIYSHHDATLYYPTAVQNNSVVTSWINNDCGAPPDNACPSKIQSGYQSNYLSKMTVTKTQIDNASQWFDNNNRDIILQDVRDDNYSANDLFDDLKNPQILLSDEVLLNTFIRNNKLSNSQLLTLLKNNAPHSNEILASLEYHYPTLVSTYKDSIIYYQGLTNARADSLAQLYYLKDQYYQYFYTHLQQLAEFDSVDQVIPFLEKDSSLSATLSLIPILIDEGYLNEAMGYLDALPDFYEEIVKFKKIYDIVIENIDSMGVVVLDSTYITVLESIASSQTPSSAIAKNILSYSFERFYPEYYLLPTQKSQKKEDYQSGIFEVIDGFELFPNPANKYINIRISDDLTGWIKIFNLRGEVVYTTKVLEKELIIDLDGWADGLYIVKFQNSENQKIKKFIIQK